MTLRMALQRNAQELLLVWWIGAFALTHMPLTNVQRGIPNVDILVHVFLYGGLAFLLATCWRPRRQLGWRAGVLFVGLLLYAVVDEVSQQFVGRTPDVRDGIVDMVGVGIGLLAYVWLLRRVGQDTT